MNTDNYEIETIRQEIVKNHLEVTALIQDIQQCTGPLEFLNELNAEGRGKIASLRSSIDRLVNATELEINEKKKSELLVEIENHRAQMSTTMKAFRKANVISSCVIDKMSRDDLLASSEEQQDFLRKRRDKKSLVDTSSQVTDKLSSISRQLAETTQRSADTLESLITSSEKVTGTERELVDQRQVIVQSGKLLGKYGRREITDKILLALAFAFFLACVGYILQKRLSWL
ncbi:vesicle transport protein SEC20 [Leptopilina boulardi]|uniref:vesicle transport protein SEC20 n=1 Tax=Leptopilina boulardi TaxID=63433 RepID=UPI0021F5C2E9|nr:vesicle transport protein SEC20 [Leptopilina boulardi]